MQPASLHRFKRVLCLGAHADDIEIGCGGTILKLTTQRRDVDVCWVVFSADDLRRREAKAGARACLARARSAEVVVEDFRQSFFPYQGAAIKERFEALKAFRPDVVFVHHQADRHQDHRVLAELAWSTFRDHVILEYEVPKYDGDLGLPNVFVPLEHGIAERKVRTLLRSFPSQADRHWFTEDTFMALMRVRGVECASPSGFAEAFHSRKLVVDFA